jgi:hypothetical protein
VPEELGSQQRLGRYLAKCILVPLPPKYRAPSTGNKICWARWILCQMDYLCELMLIGLAVVPSLIDLLSVWNSVFVINDALREICHACVCIIMFFHGCSLHLNESIEITEQNIRLKRYKYTSIHSTCCCAMYSVSINSFPDYKHLLQENYVEQTFYNATQLK